MLCIMTGVTKTCMCRFSWHGSTWSSLWLWYCTRPR